MGTAASDGVQLRKEVETCIKSCLRSYEATKNSVLPHLKHEGGFNINNLYALLQFRCGIHKACFSIHRMCICMCGWDEKMWSPRENLSSTRCSIPFSFTSYSLPWATARKPWKSHNRPLLNQRSHSRHKGDPEKKTRRNLSATMHVFQAKNQLCLIYYISLHCCLMNMRCLVYSLITNYLFFSPRSSAFVESS
jgi:hypothetical protein